MLDLRCPTREEAARLFSSSSSSTVAPGQQQQQQQQAGYQAQADAEAGSNNIVAGKAWATPDSTSAASGMSMDLAPGAAAAGSEEDVLARQEREWSAW